MGSKKVSNLAARKWLRRTAKRLKSAALKVPYRRLWTRFLALSWQTRLALTIVLLIGAAFAVKDLTTFIANSKSEVAGATDSNTPVDIGSQLTGPNYNTLLPGGKSIEQLGGWTRVSPTDRNPVFAYRDYIGEKPINVSQQPLPDAFKHDVDATVAELAHSYHADDSIKAGGTTVYIGTSAKGPQSVILSKDGLLILIKSSVPISHHSWQDYIDSLH